MTLRWVYLGRVPYQAALELQHRVRDDVLARRCPDTLLLLEHPPVITLGRSADERNVLVSAEQLAQRGVERVQIGRGGDVTYHGPGQLVGYPIRYIGRAVRSHVAAIIAALTRYLERRGIATSWRDDAPGLWTPQGKVAAVGVDARSRVTLHGFSFNISPSLEYYRLIVPCGLTAPVTSLAELGVSPLPSVAQAADEMARLLAEALGVALEPVTPEQIRGAA